MIDWTKPLELMDGTPVRLCDASRLDGVWGASNPDRDGDYWIEREDGLRIDELLIDCVAPVNSRVRNRAEPKTVTPDEIPEWVKVGEIAKSSVTLRDRFAMAALAGSGGDMPVAAKDRANWAYKIADAMMAARNG